VYYLACEPKIGGEGPQGRRHHQCSGHNPCQTEVHVGVRKQEIISFKVDGTLARALQAIPNRSEFIRSAILAALDSACPLCGGTGILSADQREHWRRFAATHELVECGDCHAFHLQCAAEQTECTPELAPED